MQIRQMLNVSGEFILTVFQGAAADGGWVVIKLMGWMKVKGYLYCFTVEYRNCLSFLCQPTLHILPKF
jgi:hypothetical protein